MALRGINTWMQRQIVISRHTPANKEYVVRIILTLLITCLGAIETVRADIKRPLWH